MTALLVINYDVLDAGRLEAYRSPAAAALVGPDKGTVIAATHATVDLGEGHGGGASTVVLEYTSAEAAREAFDSDEYQAVIGERLTVTTPRFAVIVPT